MQGRIGQWLTIAYTGTSALPSGIRRAATLLVAAWMRPRLGGAAVAAAGGITKAVIGDAEVEYASTIPSASGIPDNVRDLVLGARTPVYV